ncbi:MAG: hypothetical protein AAGB48_02035 [Planctomycetota bacterium]
MPEPLEPYRRAVEASGPGFDALLWRNKAYQEIRFKVLLEVAATGLAGPTELGTILRLEGRTVIDIGCGVADLAGWIRSIGLEVGGYIGVEGVPELAAASRARMPGLGFQRDAVIEADFAQDDALFDRLAASSPGCVFVFSGSLNTFEVAGATGVIERAHRAVLRSVDANGSGRADRSGGVVFNFLSAGLGAPENSDTGPAHRFDALEMLRHFADAGTRSIFRRDYLGAHDATIGLFPLLPDA